MGSWIGRRRHRTNFHLRFESGRFGWCWSAAAIMPRNGRQSPRSRARSVGLFCGGGARPPLEAMIAFIDDHRDNHGVEAICKLLPIAPSTYRAHAARRRDPAKASARAGRDATLREKIQRVFDANFQVYGVRKVWKQLDREGEKVVRCTVARLMQSMGLQGVVRGRPVKTVIRRGALTPYRHGEHKNMQEQSKTWFCDPSPIRGKTDEPIHTLSPCDRHPANILASTSFCIGRLSRCSGDPSSPTSPT
jgi:hypothetical protein